MNPNKTLIVDKGDRALSPYLVGAGLGLLNSWAFASAKRGLGVTSAFESAAALGARELAPDAVHVNDYLKAREQTPKVDWETFVVLGLFAGSMWSAHAAGQRSKSGLPPDWVRRFGPSPGKRYAAAFAGGAALMFGARMAQGCTSGHGLTGMSQLAVSSWVFTPLMFASAILVTRALFGREATR